MKSSQTLEIFTLKIVMAPASQEDIDWFKSTFHPIPKPQLPDDCVEYSLYWIPATSQVGEYDLARAKLSEVQRVTTALVKQHLKDYIWQRESFNLETAREDGIFPLCTPFGGVC